MPGERSKRLTPGYFQKIYHTANLLDLDWEARVVAIMQLPSQHSLIPPVAFERDDTGNLHYRQQRIRKVQPDLSELQTGLVRLAEELERLSGTGFVHGDINFKNLLYDGESYRLIDLEPSLRQCRKGRVTLLYTPPYITLSDFRHDRLTDATDKVGFYFFCRRMLNPITMFSPLHEMRRIQSGQCIIERYTGLPEHEFLDLGYRSITETCLSG